MEIEDTKPNETIKKDSRKTFINMISLYKNVLQCLPGGTVTQMERITYGEMVNK